MLSIYNKFYKDLFKFPYPLDSLEPYISSKTNDLHYNNHFSTYVNNLNNLLREKNIFHNSSLEEIILESYGDFERLSIYNNAAQISNHMYFWMCLTSDKQTAGPLTNNLINKSFGSFKNFEEKMLTSGTSLFGNGWLWLIIKNNGELDILSTVNAFTPINMDITKEVLIAIDLWEHSYYIDYMYKRKDYIINVLSNLINWNYIEQKLIAHVV